MFNFLRRKQPSEQKPEVKEKPFTMDDLAAMLIDAARKAGALTDPIYDPVAHTIKEGQRSCYIGNFYHDYLQAVGTDRDHIFSNFLSIMTRKTDPLSLEEARSKVVAAVRERVLFSFTEIFSQLEGFTKKPEPVFEPLSDWFARCLVLDFPQHVSYVGQTDLERWGISFYELYEIGLNRLRDCTVPKFQPENGYYRGAWNDDYDCSRILLPEIFSGLSLTGDPVICVPNRNILLVTGSEDEKGIAAMLQGAEEIIRGKSRPMNPAPLILKNDGIEDFSVPANSSSSHQVARAKGLAALSYYQQQKENLDKLYKKEGKDHFIAKNTLHQLKNGSYVSLSVWSNTVRTLLPKTDHIAFYDPTRPEAQQNLGFAKWKDVERIAGDLMMDAQLFPPLYYVSSFPTERQLADLNLRPALGDP